MTSKRMTISEYARHRGQTRQYVHALIRKGRIRKGDDGLLDPVECDRLAPIRKPKGKLRTVADEQRRKYAAQAEALELDLRKRRGELVDLKTYAALLYSVCRGAADRFRLLPDALADRLAGIDDAQEIRDLLRNEIDDVLRNFAERIQADALPEASEPIPTNGAPT